MWRQAPAVDLLGTRSSPLILVSLWLFQQVPLLYMGDWSGCPSCAILIILAPGCPKEQREVDKCMVENCERSSCILRFLPKELNKNSAKLSVDNDKWSERHLRIFHMLSTTEQFEPWWFLFCIKKSIWLLVRSRDPMPLPAHTLVFFMGLGRWMMKPNRVMPLDRHSPQLSIARSPSSSSFSPSQPCGGFPRSCHHIVLLNV